MTDQESSKRALLSEKNKSAGNRDSAVTVALIRGVATVLAAIIMAIIGPLLARETPSIRETQTSPSPPTASEEASDSGAQLR